MQKAINACSDLTPTLNTFQKPSSVINFFLVYTAEADAAVKLDDCGRGQNLIVQAGGCGEPTLLTYLNKVTTAVTLHRNRDVYQNTGLKLHIRDHPRYAGKRWMG